MSQADPNHVILRTIHLSKRYGSVVALQSVSFELTRGEIVGLIGDNGAGKSTLINLIAGALQPDGGHMLIEGQHHSFHSPRDARRAGVETVYQDLALAPHLPVWANMFLGRELRKPTLGGLLSTLDVRAMTASTNVALATLGIDLGAKVASPIGSLSGGQRQAVAVARAVHWGASLLLMDEPTAALGVEQTARVGTLIKEATTAGVGVLVVSHDLPWVQAICDKTIVLYRGRLVAVLERQASLETMVGWITGSLIPRRSVDIHASPGALGV